MNLATQLAESTSRNWRLTLRRHSSNSHSHRARSATHRRRSLGWVTAYSCSCTRRPTLMRLSPHLSMFATCCSSTSQGLAISRRQGESAKSSIGAEISMTLLPSWRTEICRSMKSAAWPWPSEFSKTPRHRATSQLAMPFSGGFSMATQSRTREGWMVSKTLSRKELGDFQTPPELAIDCARVLSTIQCGTRRVLEPTCGEGSFMLAAASVLKSSIEMLGVEIQPAHADVARRLLKDSVTKDVAWRVEVGDMFRYDLGKLQWETDGPLLVLGNPPWVTLSDLGAMRSTQVPDRANLRSVRGIDALTGESNFDVAEYIWMRLLTELRREEPTVALLCKTSVARRVLTLAAHLDLHVADSFLWRIDAKKAFGVAVDACFFAVRLDGSSHNYRCQVFESLDASRSMSTMGLVDGALVADVDVHATSRKYDGSSPVEWRQGVKHDLAAVMELHTDENGKLHNALGEAVEVEHDWVYPLLKGADVNAGRAPERCVIVTQRSLTDETKSLRHTSPKLWSYLQIHAERFAARKSSIYRNRAAFSMFGIGPYTFAPWKVAVSGLHKAPRFRLVGPQAGRPVLFDDTSYFLPCESAAEAAILLSVLNSDAATLLLKSLLFADAKRPVTKKLLQRIDLAAILRRERAGVEKGAQTALDDVGQHLNVAAISRAADQLLEQWDEGRDGLSLFDFEDFAALESVGAL
ncbi:MAG: N-6 DNA methylase [Acidimicrobiaceae bacterium]|nr:N-6 DNA methylase [Acidimicrobiaceae bacterium]MYC41691.1 N-6 DNA methylase [Acidimicrobiaceae bacterium]